MVRVALAGPMGSGKSTVACMFSQHNFEIRSIADPMKQIAMYLWDLDFMSLYGIGGKSKRETLLWLGKIFREYDKDVWVNFFLRNLPDADVVCDDLRMTHELSKLKKEGFVTIWLDCSLSVRKSRREEQDSYVFDETENSLKKDGVWDYVIDTSLPLDATRARISEIVRELKTREKKDIQERFSTLVIPF